MIKIDPSFPDNAYIFPLEKLPLSWTAMALAKGCLNNCLHPANKGQGWISAIGGLFVRPLLRTIYALAVTILISTPSMIYHFNAGLYEGIKSKKEYSWEHFKAAGVDFLWLSSVILTLGIACFSSYGIGGNLFDQKHQGITADAATPFGALYVTSMMFSSSLIRFKDDNEKEFVAPCDRMMRDIFYSSRC